MRTSPEGRLKMPVLPDGSVVRVPAAFTVTCVETGTWRLERPVLDPSRCSRCGVCERYCPLQIISMGETGPVFDLRFCKGCGICANECPKEALSMRPEQDCRQEGEKTV
jgi:pyruvate ferredoxin oxidoreductase delta subunit